MAPRAGFEPLLYNWAVILEVPASRSAKSTHVDLSQVGMFRFPENIDRGDIEAELALAITAADGTYGRSAATPVATIAGM